MRRVKRSKAKRGFMQIGAVAGAMLVFMNVNAAPLSAKDSPIKTASLKQGEAGLSGNITNVNTNVNSLTDFEYEKQIALLNEKMAAQKKESILYGNAAEALQLCSKFYSAADYEALGLPMVQAVAGAHLYVNANEESAILHTFGDKESVDLLYECEGGSFYYVEYNGTFRGYAKKADLNVSALSSAQIEQLSIVNRSRFVAVPSGDIYLWSKPAENGEMLAVVEGGVSMHITGVQGDWLQVNVAGTTGYVRVAEVTVDRALTAEVDGEGYIKTVRAEMELAEQQAQEALAEEDKTEEITETEPEESSTEEAVDEAVAETPVEDEAVEEPVETPVEEEPVEETPAEEEGTVSGSPSSVGVAIMNSALNYLGVPYVYGGASPSGFDCSGLVYYCAQLNGVSIPRTADAQYFANGSYVSFDELAEGDLVFFSADWSSEIEHIGIYIGGGQFVHAPSTGDVVKISELSGYYSRNYWGALRLS